MLLKCFFLGGGVFLLHFCLMFIDACTHAPPKCFWEMIRFDV